MGVNLWDIAATAGAFRFSISEYGYDPCCAPARSARVIEPANQAQEVTPHAEPSAGPGASAVQTERTENTPPATTDAARSEEAPDQG